ncbi:hypothetical protein PF003_g37886 [Phytophthora fragariae]|nr:hypothetical protein PF003_g37886 [Phytophthora fragariae]
MMALDEDDEAPSLDVWNIHFSTHTTEDKLTTGGWVLYHQMLNCVFPEKQEVSTWDQQIPRRKPQHER